LLISAQGVEKHLGFFVVKLMVVSRVKIGDRELEVVWENEDILVVNKPNGMVCVREEYPKEWPVVAHRLDKETSGALVLAKNSKALEYLMGQFKKRKIDKEYVALVHGWVEPLEGRIKLPLGNKNAGDVRRSVRYDGKMADTAWKVIDKFKKDDLKFSLLRLKIYTGRTHQIRVHLSHLGYPIFADSQYLSGSQSKLDRKILKRHFLHAKKIGFHLENGEKKEVEVSLSSDLQKVLDSLVRC
jgi:23S rRNA pseudouridine1911/1915/1917 synthase